MLSEKASNPVDVRITGRLDTIHELLNFTDVLQEVRDSECLVYKVLKTSLFKRLVFCFVRSGMPCWLSASKWPRFWQNDYLCIR